MKQCAEHPAPPDDAAVHYAHGGWTLRAYALPAHEYIFGYCREPNEADPEYGRDIDHLNDYRPGDAEVVGGMIKIRQNGRYGFCSRYGRLVVPCVYDYAGQFDNGLCIVGAAGRYGIIDTAGNTVVPPAHGPIYWHCETPATALELPGKYLLAVPAGPSPLPHHPYAFAGEPWQLLEADALSAYMPGVLWRNTNKLLLRSGGRYGIMDCLGNLCAPFAYDSIQFNGIARKNGRYALLDETGREVLPAEFDRIQKLTPHAEISAERRGDIVVAARGTGRDSVYTSNGLLLCEMPPPPYTGADVIACILGACLHTWLDENHAIFRAGGRYGVLQTVGVSRHTICGQRFIGFCEVIPFIWERPESCGRAYRFMMEAFRHETGATQVIDPGDPKLAGPFFKQYHPPGPRREGAWGVYNEANDDDALPAEYRRFVSSQGINNETYHGFTALKDGRWYFIEIQGGDGK